MVMRGLFLLLLVAVGCDAGFEDEDVVIDLRILAVSAEPPEQVLDVDVDDPLAAVSQLQGVTLRALVADPTESRRLAWRMRACPPTRTHQCDGSEQPVRDIAEGIIEDPETAGAPGIEALFFADVELLESSLDSDENLGFAGIVVQIELAVAAEGAGFERAELAKKRVVYAPRIPEERVANTNPTLAGLTVAGEESAATGGCSDPAMVPIEVPAGGEVRLEPVEPEGVRENYVLPTFDGDVQELTEYMRYAWLATAGSFSPGNTGGSIDEFGNVPKLRTDYDAPAETGPVELWLVQRDERGGTSWTRRCLLITP